MLTKARKYKQVIGYGAVFALLMLVIRWLEIRYIIMAHAFEIYAGAIALIFTCLGIWLALKLVKPKIHTQVIEREIYRTATDFAFNQEAFEKLGLSKRELEVLQLMARGASNQEIADQLFVSLNTIKTHVSRLFEKLEVKRRTQAVELAQKLSLIP
ncbi:response regulator transcription factor [Pedobacter sp. KR3-3]|uniref:Response regulator transcription factor n=1 Tax=Pedobacter albus TaxID=3113905 RepID=A0ABU7I403_9SPHI|nr:response regulator transcription factor [Pedobacter sp. KR3-3]MEE1944119.1 response regulator transcription factor [Pedobacter sp. KR3-3]